MKSVQWTRLIEKATKTGEAGVPFTGLPPVWGSARRGGFLLKERVTAIQREDLASKSAACRPSLNLIPDCSSFCQIPICPCIWSGNNRGYRNTRSADTHLAFEMGIVWKNWRTKSLSASGVSRQRVSGFILYPIEFSVDTFFIR